MCPQPAQGLGSWERQATRHLLLNSTTIGSRRLEEGPHRLASGPCCVPGTPISSARHTKLLPPAQRSRVVTRPLAGRPGGLCPWGPPPDSSLPAPSALATPHPQSPGLAQVKMEHLHWGLCSSVLLWWVDLTNPTLLSSPLSLDSSQRDLQAGLFFNETKLACESSPLGTRGSEYILYNGTWESRGPHVYSPGCS